MEVTKIQPLGKIILIAPIHTESKFITDDKSITSKVKVMAIGNEVTSVKVGDTIIANYWGTDTVEVDGETYHFVKDSDDYILAKYDSFTE